jgi:hypothetical protein
LTTSLAPVNFDEFLRDRRFGAFDIEAIGKGGIDVLAIAGKSLFRDIPSKTWIIGRSCFLAKT